MYRILKENTFKDQEAYQLRPIQEADIEQIRLWRNAQIDILRQKTLIAPEEQKKYFQESVWPTFVQAEPKQILFGYFYQHLLIGYGGFVNIDWEFKRAEVSFLVNSERVQNPKEYERDFTHFLALLCIVAFRDLNWHRLFTETFAFRVGHMEILEKFGFRPEGVLREHVYKQGKWQDSIMHGLLAHEVYNA